MAEGDFHLIEHASALHVPNDPADTPAPVDPAVVRRVSEALASAIATKLPGLPYAVELDYVELAVLSLCFEVGGDHEAITDEQWQAVHDWFRAVGLR